MGASRAKGKSRRTQVREVRNCGARKEFEHDAEKKENAPYGVSHREADRQFAAGAPCGAGTHAGLLSLSRLGRGSSRVLDVLRVPAFSLHRLEFSALGYEGQANENVRSQLGIAPGD